MSICNKYHIIMKTPMGKKQGQLTLNIDGCNLTGYMNILGHKNNIQNGKVMDGKFSFTGQFVTPIRTIEYSAVGVANDKDISFDVKAGIMNLYISGEMDSNSG